MSRHTRTLIVLIFIFAPGYRVFADTAADFFMAIRIKDSATVKAMLVANPKLVKARNRFRDLPLFVAVDSGDREMVKLLLRSGADVDAKDGNGNGLLLRAGITRDARMVHLVLDRGVRSNDLSWAAEYGHVATIRKALKADPAGAKRAHPKYGSTLLHAAASGGSKQIVKLLLARGADPNAKTKNGRTPLFDAASALLLRSDPDWWNTEIGNRKLNQRAQKKARRKAYMETIKALATAEANPNIAREDGKTPLGIALLRQDTEVARLLLSIGADAKAEMFRQVGKGTPKGLSMLLDMNPDLTNATDERGFTPLHHALLVESRSACDVLLAHNVKTDIFTAAGLGMKRRLAALLQENPALLNAKDHYKNTPLNWALRAKTNDAVELLLAKGARINAKNKNGDTALHLAAHARKPNLVKLLLEKGAEVNAVNTRGRTPLDQALRARDKEAAQILRKHGGKQEKPAKRPKGSGLHEAIPRETRTLMLCHQLWRT